MKKQLRDYQEAANNEAKQHLRQSADPFLMVLSVGSGKTLMIADLAKNTVSKGGTVLVLSHQGELIQQNSDEAWAYGLPNSIFAASLGVKGTSINPIFAMRQTLVNALNDPEFYSARTDLIIVDEVHTFDFLNPESGAGKIIKHFNEANERWAANNPEARHKPKLRVVGLTGTPYRNNEPLYGNGFWKAKTSKDITLRHQIEQGWITDFHYGLHGDDEALDLSTLNIRHSEESGGNYSEEDFDRILQGEYHKTMEICHNVNRKARTVKGGCLIFCGSKLHTEQVKIGLLNAGAKAEEIVIVTDSTKDNARADALAGAKDGRYKFFINVAVASTGWNCPMWEYLVYMRPVGSRTFFEQSIGRVLRTRIDDEFAAEFNTTGTTRERRLELIAASDKPFAIVDDYAGVVEKLGDTLEDYDEVQEAKREKAIRDGETKVCPICSYENGAYAQRCMNVYEQKQLDSSFADSRCLHYWQFNECRDTNCRDELGRHTQNSVTAKTCRVCDKILSDPNKALLNRAYRDDEYREVEKMTIDMAKNEKGVVVKFHLKEPDPDLGTPYLYFHLDGSDLCKRIWYNEFCKIYINGGPWQSRARNMSASAAVRNAAMFNTPTHITVRKNDKNKFIIGRRLFRSGREVTDETQNPEFA